jgi:hypothetical protein
LVAHGCRKRIDCCAGHGLRRNPFGRSRANASGACLFLVMRGVSGQSPSASAVRLALCKRLQLIPLSLNLIL